MKTSSRLPEKAANMIKSWIVTEKLKPGDRLPREDELIEKFGMAKSTIRESMRILETQGLLKSKTGPGGGVFIDNVSEARSQALLRNFFYFRELTVAGIYQLRISLEPELAASLSGRLTEEQIGELREHITKYEEPPHNLEEEKYHHIESLAFHTMLANFSKNELLGFTVRFMIQLLSDLTTFKRLYDPPNYVLWSKGYDHHNRLIQAMEIGHAEEARHIMKSHMQIAQTLMEGQENIVRNLDFVLE